jgi:hypothetical protein
LRREATIYERRPISARSVEKPQQYGYWRAPTYAPVCRSDSNHMRRRGAKSFVDDLVLSRGVVLSRADLFCDLLRLSPLTRRFVRFRRTYLRRPASIVSKRRSTIFFFFPPSLHSVPPRNLSPFETTHIFTIHPYFTFLGDHLRTVPTSYHTSVLHFFPPHHLCTVPTS